MSNKKCPIHKSRLFNEQTNASSDVQRIQYYNHHKYMPRYKYSTQSNYLTDRVPVQNTHTYAHNEQEKETNLSCNKFQGMVTCTRGVDLSNNAPDKYDITCKFTDPTTNKQLSCKVFDEKTCTFYRNESKVCSQVRKLDINETDVRQMMSNIDSKNENGEPVVEMHNEWSGVLTLKK